MNGETQNIGGAVSNSVTGLWDRFIGFLPELISAILILVLGYIVAKLIGGIVKKLLETAKIDETGRNMGVHKFLRERGMDFSFTKTIAWLAKWFFFLAFFVAAVEVLGVPELSRFINSIIGYIPSVILAVAIISVGFIAAKYVGDLVEKSTRVSDTLRTYSNELAMLASGAIAAFSIMAALVQLGIAASLITIIFAGLIGMIALAGGLAFGLGGRENAKRLIDRLERQSEEVNPDVAYAASEEEVKECLTGKAFPAQKDEVVSYCKDSKAKTVLENIDERDYTSITDVIRGMRDMRKAFR